MAKFKISHPRKEVVTDNATEAVRAACRIVSLAYWGVAQRDLIARVKDLPKGGSFSYHMHQGQSVTFERI